MTSAALEFGGIHGAHGEIRERKALLEYMCDACILPDDTQAG